MTGIKDAFRIVRPIRRALIVAFALLSAAPVVAIDTTWKPGGPTMLWHEPLNWTHGVPQNAGDVARFSNPTFATTSAQVDAPATLAQLRFSGLGHFELAGAGPLTFDSLSPRMPAIIALQPAGGLHSELTAVIEAPIIIPAAETLNVSLASRSSIRLRGPVSGDGGVSYTGRPTGFGSEIRGANSYTGSTTIDLGIDYHIDIAQPTAFGDASRETILRSGRISLWEGTAEEFVVEGQGILIPTPSALPYTGRITLAGGSLLPSARGLDEDELSVQIDSEVVIRGRGFVGLSPYGGNNAELHGPINGGGLLVFQGSGDITTLGPIEVRGDVLGSDRAVVDVAGQFRPAGDLKVDGGIAHARIRLSGDNSQFAGDIETRLGRLVVGSDIHTDNLRIDARLATWRESLQIGGVTIEPGATLEAGALEFYAGDIEGRLAGVDQITKRTRIAGSLSRLEDFAGVVTVEEGLLDVKDSAGLGTAAGGAEVLRPRGAAIVLYRDARIEDAIYLNNATGFDYSGALLGPGEVAGPLYLGDEGAYIGGQADLNNGTIQRGSDLRISGSIHGGALYKAGAHTNFTLTSTGHTYAGDTHVLSGQLTLTDNARLEATPTIRVGGGRLNSSTQPNATLMFDDRGAVRSQDRLADDVPVRLHSGRLELQGVSGLSSETVGQVALDGGWNRINATGGVLRVDELERNPNALISFLPGEAGRIEIGAAPLDDNILGGWALYHRQEYRPEGFATVAGGVVQSADAVEQSLNVSTVTQNVEVIAPNTLTRDVSVNSLKTGGNAAIDLAGHTLTVDSGGILALGETTIAGGRLTAGDGGPSELFLHDYWNLAVDADIVDNAGPLTLHVSGIGFVNLSGDNSYTGGTHITKSSGIHVQSRSAVPAGDVVEVDSGHYLIDFDDGQPLEIERLVLRGSGLVEGSSSTPLDANVYELYSGWIQQPIAGDGRIIKCGEGRVELSELNDGFTGAILVEQGVLELQQAIGWTAPTEETAVTVREGGVLATRGLPDGRLLILEGGELRMHAPSGSAPAFPIEVRGGGLISGSGGLGSPIRGDGDLTIDGPFNNSLSVERGFNALNGDVTITGGVVNINAHNSSFPGVVHIRAAGARTLTPNAFGPAGGVVHPEGILTVDNTLAAPVHLAGGLLRAGSLKTSVHHLNVVADSEIDTGEFFISGTPAPVELQTFHSATFADNIRVKKTGPGKLTLGGVLTFGQNVEIVAWEGEVELRGAINATPGSSLSFRGNDNLLQTGSLYLPAGSSFQLTGDGVPQELRFASSAARLTGLGTVHNDVDVRHQGEIAPGPGSGMLRIDGDLTIGPGAHYRWELADAAGTPGAADGWDLIEVAGTLDFESSSFWRLTITSAGQPITAGELAAAIIAPNLGPGSQQWLIATAAEITGFDPSAVTIDATHLIAERPQYSQGAFHVLADGGNLYAVYALPEPAAACLVLAAIAFIPAAARRRPPILLVLLLLLVLAFKTQLPTAAAPPDDPSPALLEVPKPPRPIRIAIYQGPGSQDSGIRDVERGVKLLGGASIERLPAKAFTDRDLREFDVIVFSAGGASTQARDIGDTGRQRVRQFVEDGGAYLGICAGAYLACAEFDWGLKLIAAETLSDRWQRGEGEVQMQLTPGGRRAFGPAEAPLTVAYENGPVIGPIEVEGLPPYRTLATFTTELAENGSPPGIMTGSPSIAEAALGQGRVMIFSPHPERTAGLDRFIPLAIARLTAKSADGEK